MGVLRSAFSDASDPIEYKRTDWSQKENFGSSWVTWPTNVTYEELSSFMRGPAYHSEPAEENSASLWFAGSAYSGANIGFVHGAYMSATRVASMILSEETNEAIHANKVTGGSTMPAVAILIKRRSLRRDFESATTQLPAEASSHDTMSGSDVDGSAHVEIAFFNHALEGHHSESPLARRPNRFTETSHLTNWD
ncbi:MAG: hypothetical protein MHM6MM_000717 [Cercozoa sp. M6MM]